MQYTVICPNSEDNLAYFKINCSTFVVDTQKLKEITGDNILQPSYNFDINQIKDLADTSFLSMSDNFQKTDDNLPKIDKNGIYYDITDDEFTDESSSEDSEYENEDEIIEDEYRNNMKIISEIKKEHKLFDFTNIIYVIILEINDVKYIKHGYTYKLYDCLTKLFSQLHSEYDKVIFKELVGLFRLDSVKENFNVSRRKLCIKFGTEKCLEKRFSTEDNPSYYQNYLKYSKDHLNNIVLIDYSVYCDLIYINHQFMEE